MVNRCLPPATTAPRLSLPSTTVSSRTYFSTTLYSLPVVVRQHFVAPPAPPIDRYPDILRWLAPDGPFYSHSLFSLLTLQYLLQTRTYGIPPSIPVEWCDAYHYLSIHPCVMPAMVVLFPHSSLHSPPPFAYTLCRYARHLQIYLETTSYPFTLILEFSRVPPTQTNVINDSATDRRGVNTYLTFRCYRHSIMFRTFGSSTFACRLPAVHFLTSCLAVCRSTLSAVAVSGAVLVTDTAYHNRHSRRYIPFACCLIL